MKKEEYRAAFSKLQPSREAVDRLLAIPEEQPKRGRPIRLGALIAVATIVVLLLAGTVYAVTNWFRLSDANQIEDPNQYDPGTPSQPAPQHAINLEEPAEGNYIGFTLDGWSLPDRKQSVNNVMLKNVLANRNPNAQPTLDAGILAIAYTQYFPITLDGEMLCIQVLDRDGLGYRDYFTRYETTLVKEGTLNGMDAVWLTIREPQKGNEPGDTYHLFCHSEALHCVLVVSSNRGFDRAEEAVSHLTLVDSGVPLNRKETMTVFGLRLAELPAEFEIDQELTEPLDSTWTAWKRKDPDADLTGAYGCLVLVRPTDGLKLFIGAKAHHVDYEHIGGYELNRTGIINGHEVLWLNSVNSDAALVYRYEDGTQVELFAKGSGEEIDALLAQLAISIELVPMEIIHEAPLEFTGLYQG